MRGIRRRCCAGDRGEAQARTGRNGERLAIEGDRPMAQAAVPVGKHREQREAFAEVLVDHLRAPDFVRAAFAQAEQAGGGRSGCRAGRSRRSPYRAADAPAGGPGRRRSGHGCRARRCRGSSARRRRTGRWRIACVAGPLRCRRGLRDSCGSCSSTPPAANREYGCAWVCPRVEGGPGRPGPNGSAVGASRGHFETETQVGEAGLGPHGVDPSGGAGRFRQVELNISGARPNETFEGVFP